MTKFRYMFMMFIAIFAVALLVPAFAEDEADPEGTFTEKDLKDLPRWAFFYKTADGKEWVCLRLSKYQYAKTLVTKKVFGKQAKAHVEITLNPRQLKALSSILNLDLKHTVTLIVSHPNLQYVKRLTRGMYIMREKAPFVIFLGGIKEAAEPTEQPASKTLADLNAVWNAEGKIVESQPEDPQPEDPQHDATDDYPQYEKTD